jgi:hypothetical protein
MTVGTLLNMNENTIPPYDIIPYPIDPPVGRNRFGAKPLVASSYEIKPDDPWNKECWGATESEAIANAQAAIDSWIKNPR